MALPFPESPAAVRQEHDTTDSIKRVARLEVTTGIQTSSRRCSKRRMGSLVTLLGSPFRTSSTSPRASAELRPVEPPTPAVEGVVGVEAVEPVGVVEAIRVRAVIGPHESASSFLALLSSLEQLAYLEHRPWYQARLPTLSH